MKLIKILLLIIIVIGMIMITLFKDIFSIIITISLIIFLLLFCCIENKIYDKSKNKIENFHNDYFIKTPIHFLNKNKCNIVPYSSIFKNVGFTNFKRKSNQIIHINKLENENLKDIDSQLGFQMHSSGVKKKFLSKELPDHNLYKKRKYISDVYKDINYYPTPWYENDHILLDNY